MFHIVVHSTHKTHHILDYINFMPNIWALKNSKGVLLHSYPIDVLEKFSFQSHVCHSIWIGLVHSSYNVQGSVRLRNDACKYKRIIFYLAKERTVSVPWADRERTGSVPCAYRECSGSGRCAYRERTVSVTGADRVRTVSVPGADRVRIVSGPWAYRERTGSGPCAYRKCSGSGSCAYRERTVSVPGAYRVRTVSVPGADRVRIVSGPWADRERTVCVPTKRPALLLIADKSLARPGRKQANVSVRMTWISFGALPCRKRNLMTAHVSMLLKSRTSLICFRACFLPVRAKDLSAPRYTSVILYSVQSVVSSWMRETWQS